MSVLELMDVSVAYGATAALRSISLRTEGSVIGLVGPNGSGKTTLMRMVMGLVRFTGQARVLGHALADADATLRDRIGYVPDHRTVPFAGRAIDYCVLAARLSGLGAHDALAEAHAALDAAGVDGERYHTVARCPPGLTQRIKLAQALSSRPDLLVLDEPTAGLDVHGRTRMLGTLRRLASAGGPAILLSTHIFQDLASACDFIIALDRGAVRHAGRPPRPQPGAVGELELATLVDNTVLLDALRAAGMSCTRVSSRRARVRLDGPAVWHRVLRACIDTGTPFTTLGGDDGEPDWTDLAGSP